MSKEMRSLLLCLLLLAVNPYADAQEITVLGSQQDVIAALEADRWWEKRERGIASAGLASG